jgi:hypothetical protein
MFLFELPLRLTKLHRCSRNVGPEDYASPPFRYGPARGHFFALCADRRELSQAGWAKRS